DYESFFNSSYYGILAGEAWRTKHFFLSGSVGIAYSDTKYHEVIHAYHDEFDYAYKGASMPAEIKMFLCGYFSIPPGF
ncbi:MAG: hypothetical protein ABJA76_13075, partial [Mucilaginibacter sp.]